jgi:hypothetical protein
MAKAKVDEAELELLSNLFNFCQKKYSGKSISEFEAKFGKSARELVDIGEISEASLKHFCDSEGIEVPAAKVKSSSSSSSSSSSGSYASYDPCGRSGGYRSGC